MVADALAEERLEFVDLNYDDSGGLVTVRRGGVSGRGRRGNSRPVSGAGTASV